MDEMKQKLEGLKSAQERMPADLRRYDETKQENRAFLSLNDIAETKKEVELIDKYLYGHFTDEELDTMSESIQLTAEEKMTLTNKMSMDLGHLLLNEHSKEDSSEMADVKIDVINLAKAIEQVKELPVTQESMDMVDVAFRMLTNSCKTYLDKKNPHFKKGIIRKQMVHDLWVSVLFEAEIFNMYRRVLDPKYEGSIPATMGDLLGLKKEDAVKRAPEINEIDQLYDNFSIPKEKTEKKPYTPKVSEEGKYVAESVFGQGYSFTEDIKTRFSSPKKMPEKVKEVKKLHATLKSIPRGRVTVVDLNIFGKPAKLLQKSDNSLWIIEDHVPIRLEKNFINLTNQLETEFFNNTDLYGTELVSDILEEHRGMMLKKAVSTGEHTRIRTLLGTFLSQKTGLSPNIFDNVFKEQMLDYVDAFLKGEKTAEDIKKEVEDLTSQNIMVNGVAISEMIELNKQKSIDEIAAVVKMNTEPQVEIIEEGWSEEEKQVKNMIADLIFTNDTEKMDQSVAWPDKFLKGMIKQHENAMKALIKAKGSSQDMVNEILKKMSISELEGTLDGKKVRLGSVVADVIKSLMELYEKSPEGNYKEDALIDIKKKLDKVVDQSLQIMQSNVDVMTGAIFPDQEEEKSKAKKPLRQQVAEGSKSQKGQGKFMRNVMKTYFDGVSNIDKRAMLASVFRTAKLVPPLDMTDEQIVAEIQSLKIKEYEGLFKKTKKDENGTKVMDLTSEDKKAITEYREEKQTLRIQANFMAGLFRGAGPLMQKMLQGLPTTGLPAEIKEALSDMKSNLPPIPESVVKAQFSAMVERSGGKVTKIEVKRSLGAASVGQAFLCRVYGPSEELKNGKEVVIKLLRGDATNRMLREEDIMLKAAKNTDEAMYLTYKGLLQNYKRELDLSIEAQNCRDGLKYYTKGFKDVDSMTVFEDIPATSTSMVINKAEGVTLDAYIHEVADFADKTLDDLYSKTKRSNGTVEVIKSVSFSKDPAGIEKLTEKKNILIEKVNEAIKRRDHIIHLCHTWIKEAMMSTENRFYHGDLHAGNIIINDEKATFIDFGNTVKLDKEEQVCIAQIAIAASGSIEKAATNDAVDLFFEAFNKLIEKNNDPEFLKLYDDDKKAQLKKAFGEVLVQGEDNEAGFRIELCLQKAQELGVKIPSSLHGFVQGQIRLQNSIDELNTAIEKLKEGIDTIEKARPSSYEKYDCLNVLQHKNITDGNDTTTMKDKYQSYLESVNPVNKEKFIKELQDKTYKAADMSRGIKEVNKQKEFEKKYLEKYRPLKDIDTKELYCMGMSKEDLKKIGRDDVDKLNLDGVKRYRQIAEEFFAEWKDKPASKERTKAAYDMVLQVLPINAVGSCLLDGLGGNSFFSVGMSTKLADMDWEGVDEILKVMENQVPKALFMMDAADKLFTERKDRKKRITKEREAELSEQVYKNFNDIHMEGAKTDPIMSYVMSKMDFPKSEDYMKKDLVEMFKEKTDGLGAKLEKQFNEYYNIKKKYPPEKLEDGTIGDWHVGKEDEAAYKKIKVEFAQTYRQVAKIRIKDYVSKVLEKEANIKYVDYDKVMEDVIHERMGTGLSAVANLGGIKDWLGSKTLDVAAKMMGIKIPSFLLK